MSAAVPLRTIEETLAAAAAIVAGPLDHRAATGVPVDVTLSMAVLVVHLDAIAVAAAEADAAWRAAFAGVTDPRFATAMFRAGSLAGLLIAAGYRHPDPAPQKETAHGEG